MSFVATRSATGALAAATAAGFAFVACLRKINDPDYWTHLALGRAFVAARSIFIPEPFLAVEVPAGPPPGAGRWAHVLLESSDWPFQIALATLQSVAGHGAVSVAVAASAALAVVLSARRLLEERRAERALVAVLFLVLVVLAARFRFSPRPEIAGMVLLVAVLSLAFSFTERPRKEALAGMAVLLLGWKMVHVSWAPGAALAGIALATRPRLDWLRSLRAPVRLGVFALAALAALAAARFGLFVIGELRGGGLLAAVTEMRPTWEFPSVLVPFLAVSATAGVLAWGEREGRWQRLAVWAAAVVLGISVVRTVGLAAVAMVPGAIRGLRGAAWPDAFARRRRMLAAGVGLALLVSMVLIARDRDYPFGVGVDWRHFPRDAAEFVRSTPLPPPVFNSWDWGGYVDWSWNGRPRTFLDGRLANRDALRDHDLVAAGAPEGPIARHGFRTVLLRPVFLSSGRLVPAVPWFLGHPEWRLVRATDGLVFARTPLPAGVEEAPREAAWEVVLDGARLAADQNDAAPHADFTRAIALLNLGRAGEAYRAFERGKKASPEIAELYGPLGAILRAWNAR